MFRKNINEKLTSIKGLSKEQKANLKKAMEWIGNTEFHKSGGLLMRFKPLVEKLNTEENKNCFITELKMIKSMEAAFAVQVIREYNPMIEFTTNDSEFYTLAMSTGQMFKLALDDDKEYAKTLNVLIRKERENRKNKNCNRNWLFEVLGFSQ